MPEVSLFLMGGFVTALAVVACMLIGKAEAEDIRQAEIDRQSDDAGRGPTSGGA